MKKILTMCAGALSMGALVVGSLNLWASEHMSEGQLDNVEALEPRGAGVSCEAGSGLCKAVCTTCGAVIENSTGGQPLHVNGRCPVCGETNFYYH